MHLKFFSILLNRSKKEKKGKQETEVIDFFIKGKLKYMIGVRDACPVA